LPFLVESSSPPKGSLSPSEDDFSNDGFSTLEDFDEDSNSNLSKDETVEHSEKRKRGRPKKMHVIEDFGEPMEMDYRLQCHTCAKVTFFKYKSWILGPKVIFFVF
jgi:hypothetical protein